MCIYFVYVCTCVRACVHGACTPTCVVIIIIIKLYLSLKILQLDTSVLLIGETLVCAESIERKSE